MAMGLGRAKLVNPHRKDHLGLIAPTTRLRYNDNRYSSEHTERSYSDARYSPLAEKDENSDELMERSAVMLSPAVWTRWWGGAGTRCGASVELMSLDLSVLFRAVFDCIFGWHRCRERLWIKLYCAGGLSIMRREGVYVSIS
jgi:hypothetical protein